MSIIINIGILSNKVNKNLLQCVILFDLFIFDNILQLFNEYILHILLFLIYSNIDYIVFNHIKQHKTI